MSFRRGLVTSLVCVFVVALGAGCAGQRPENSPYIKSKFAELDEQLKDLAKVKREVTLLQDDIKYFTEELGNIRTMASGGVSPEQQDLIAQLAAKATDLEKMATDLTSAQKRIDDLEKSVASGRSAAGAASQAASIKPVANRTPASVVASSGATKSPTQSRRTSGGFYYQVKANDTLTSVATANNTSIAKLAGANNLPPDARLAVGQRLWVP
jgi:LysM repeat protein